jgi:glycerol uptake facilitator-like aquaporin
VASDFTNLSIYLVGPVIGGLLAGALWGYFLEKHEPA